MTYPTLASVNATNDVSAIFVYVNTLTDGVAMPMVLIAFFIITFIGGAFAQMRFKGSIRIDFSFATSAFVTFGLAVIMSSRSGLLNPAYLLISLAMAIVGAVWLYLAQDTN